MIRFGEEYVIAVGGYILAHPAKGRRINLCGGLENKLSVSLA